MFGKIVKPCASCPFRLEPRFYGLRRAREIADGMRVQDGTFACHETTGAKGGDDVPRHLQDHCAGAVKVMLAEGISNQMMRISHRLGFFKVEDYKGGAECFSSFDDWIEAMGGKPKRKRKAKTKKKAKAKKRKAKTKKARR